MTQQANSPKLDLKQLLTGVQLPALPESAMRLMELSRNPKNGPPEYAAVIEADPGLTAQVLRFVNSSYFGFSREISGVKHAITLVGVRTIRNFVLWNAILSLIPNPKCGPFNLKSLWQDSFRRAVFARALARVHDLPMAEDIFTAALLQDMAIPLLARDASRLYLGLLTDRAQQQVRLSKLELNLFGWTHAEGTGILARQWNLPEEIAVLVENHLGVETLPTYPQAELAKLIVALSAVLPSIVDPVWTECPLLVEHYGRASNASSPPLVELLEQTDTEFAAFAPLLKVVTPPKPLVESYAEATVPA